MKTLLRLGLLFLLASRSFETVSSGHEVPVHQRITENAANSAFVLSLGYSNFLDVVSSEVDVADARRSLSFGSAREDDPVRPNPAIPGAGGGYRSMNHFYDPLDPTYGKGLSDAPGEIRIVQGTNSFIWASVSNCVGFDFKGIFRLGRNVNTSNAWSWQNARGYEWDGLTESSRPARLSALTNMFRAVGQVVHLLQDTSQPQHVRNEQHLDKIFLIKGVGVNTAWHSPIEKYGAEHVDLLNYQQAMLSWRDAGFSKLEDFWNRHLYTGESASTLNADAAGAPEDRLGLAEFSNGNFVGDRHRYREYYSRTKAFNSNANIAYYPYPSRDSGTNYKEAKRRPSTSTDTFILKNQQQYTGVYYAKTGDGVTMAHHSRVTYLGTKFPDASAIHTTTIRDDNVLSDYHSILIPKAVEYSAGILDYFFRGTMTAGVIGFDTDYAIRIANSSGESFKDGEFSVYEEDSVGNRSLRGQDSLSGTLAAGDHKDMTFTAPTNSGDQLFLVYRGTIGLTGGSASDPVDAGIAVATARINLDPWKTTFWDITFDDSSHCTGNTGCENVGLNAFDITRQGDGTPPSESQLTGTLSYTGPAMPSKFTFLQETSCTGGTGTVTIKHNGSDIYTTNLVAGDGGEGLFTVPSSTNATIEITVTLAPGSSCSRMIGELSKQ